MDIIIGVMINHLGSSGSYWDSHKIFQIPPLEENYPFSQNWKENPVDKTAKTVPTFISSTKGGSWKSVENPWSHPTNNTLFRYGHFLGCNQVGN